MLKELKNSKFALENLRNETDIFTQFKSDSDCYYTRKKYMYYQLFLYQKMCNRTII